MSGDRGPRPVNSTPLCLYLPIECNKCRSPAYVANSTRRAEDTSFGVRWPGTSHGVGAWETSWEHYIISIGVVEDALDVRSIVLHIHSEVGHALRTRFSRHLECHGAGAGLPRRGQGRAVTRVTAGGLPPQASVKAEPIEGGTWGGLCAQRPRLRPRLSASAVCADGRMVPTADYSGTGAGKQRECAGVTQGAVSNILERVNRLRKAKRTTHNRFAQSV